MTHSLVVGGSRGIGGVIAAALLNRGDVVSILSRKAHCDITDLSKLPKVVADLVHMHGPIDNVILSQRFRADAKAPLKDAWDGELDTLISGSRNVIETTKGYFNSAGGAIVVISSTARNLVLEEQPLAYHVTRGGLEQLVRWYAVELGSAGIRVNAVSTCAVLKPESEASYRADSKKYEREAKKSPLNRMGSASDVANAVLFMCSSAATFVSGQTLAVDGGATLRFQS